MKHVGIICEFNPFHFGHAHLLQKIKEAFPEKGIVCVMSGNFVQRGEFALMEKYSRAAVAASLGADLVLELPFPFSCLSAESFGKSGVSILSRLGVLDTLAFGSEVADKERLLLCAERLSSPSFRTELDRFLEENPGYGYPAARQWIYEKHYGTEPALSLSNASLALEYLIANRQNESPLSAYCVPRVGAKATSEQTEGIFSSATAIRKSILSGENVENLLPDATSQRIEKERLAGRFPVETERLFPVLRYLLKTTPPTRWKEYYGLSSLGDRARRFIGECDSLEELSLKMKNAGVTDSRIRRAFLSLLCSIPRHAEKSLPPYTLLLAANEKGRAILSEIKEKSTVPVFTKPAHLFRSEEKGVRSAASAAALAEEIYAMAFPRRQSDGYFLKQFPTML